ncbi:MAG: lysine--tRNA ligase [Euryarchaeota archaeon]|nr:lysine--tRNA ligase [Euryarchaeota archaeon]
MHWADVIALDLISKTESHLISTGITPSGTLHVGTLREAITAEAVRKSVVEAGGNVRMIYLIDSFDPLRRRYPFLPESFEAEVGRPLSHIPCPCGKHDNYAHHYIQPFLDSIQELGIHCQVLWTHEQYEEGKFADVIDIAITNKDRVAKILEEVSGRDLPEDFYPYTPRCKECGRLSHSKVIGYEKPFVSYQCACGYSGKADIRKADGKMPWRVEWAAKWKVFGVTCEPFGKDHAAAGGSYDTGVRLAEEVFGIEPPRPIAYEFVQLKGKGQMHKSTGSPVTGVDALNITPPQVMNYIILRVNPERHIDYDSGIGILDMVDEYDRTEKLFFSGEASEKDMDILRAYELSQPEGPRSRQPLQIPYRHLVSLVQIVNGFDGVVTTLTRMEMIDDSVDPEDMAILKQRVDCVNYWLDGFAPNQVKFEVCMTIPGCQISEQEKEFLSKLYDSICIVDWDGENIHDAIYLCAKESPLGPRGGFRILYRIFCDQKQGPRLGFFFSTLDRDFVLNRIKEASD